MGSIPTEVIRIFFFTLCGSLIPFIRANAHGVFHGFHFKSTLTDTCTVNPLFHHLKANVAW